MRLLLSLFLLASLASLAACTPGESPVSPDYPCGTRGRSCGAGLCCGITEECGTGLGCPVGYCCPRDDDFSAPRRAYQAGPVPAGKADR
jgi:hypothetical protein